jgi:hypothetical protein
MKIKKVKLISAKITEELWDKMQKACEKIPGMYVSVYIERAIENQTKQDLK